MSDKVFFFHALDTGLIPRITYYPYLKYIKFLICAVPSQPQIEA